MSKLPVPFRPVIKIEPCLFRAAKALLDVEFHDLIIRSLVLSEARMDWIFWSTSIGRARGEIGIAM